MSVKPGYEARRKRDSERRRIKVLSSAGLCFSRRGYRKTTVEEVAKNSGVSKGLVFHFFGSKKALFAAVVEDALVQWAALSEYRAAGLQDDTLAELRSLFLASFDYVEQNPVLLLFDRQEEGLAQEYRREFARRNRQWRNRVQKVLKAGVQRGEIRDIDVQRVATIFHQTQIALLASASHKSAPARYDRRTIELTIDLFLRGIRREPAD